MWASRNGDKDILNMLIEAKADLDMAEQVRATCYMSIDYLQHTYNSRFEANSCMWNAERADCTYGGGGSHGYRSNIGGCGCQYEQAR